MSKVRWMSGMKCGFVVVVSDGGDGWVNVSE